MNTERKTGYQVGGTYIVLNKLDGLRMHWSIFHVVSPEFGMLYNATDSTGRWVLEHDLEERLMDSPEIRGALLIQSNPDEATQDRVHKLLLQVPCPSKGGYIEALERDFSCQTWVWDAANRLRLAGLLGDCSLALPAETAMLEGYTAEDVCDEAKALGLGAIRTGMSQQVKRSNVIYGRQSGP